MNFRTFPTAVILFLALVLALPQVAPAEAVGRLTQVEGRVDLLKGGKLPANPVKVGDAVEPGDVLRAKSLSKAQITFLDNTTLTMSPESRIAIEEYMYDAAKGKRSAVVEVFYGAVLAVVSKIYQTEQPDFVVKTHTAIMGVRGTEVGMRLSPNETTFLNFEGRIRVANIFPEVGDAMFKKAEKVAFSFGKGSVDVPPSHGTVVGRGLTPTIPFEIGPQDRKLFMQQINIVARVGGGSAVSAAASAPASTAGSGGVPETGNNTGGGLAGLIIYGTVKPALAAPPVETFSFTQIFSGYYSLSSSYSNTVGNYNNQGPITEKLGGYTATFTILADARPPGGTGTFSETVPNGAFKATSIINVSGPAGGPLSGTMQGTATMGGTSNVFTFSGPVTLPSSSNITFTTPITGTFYLGGATTPTTTGNITKVNNIPSTWTQVQVKK